MKSRMRPRGVILTGPRPTMKCVQKCEGHYSDTEMGLFLDPEKYDKFERQRFSLSKFQVLPPILRV
jgi:hypothetical protein